MQLLRRLKDATASPRGPERRLQDEATFPDNAPAEAARQNPADDQIYYRDGYSVPLAKPVLQLARTRMYDLFYRSMAPQPSSRILDVGVSDEENEASNFLEKLYPHTHMITCAGLGEGREITSHFDGISFVKVAAGEALPFADKSFDIVHSNAVLEHVGDAEERRRFLAELRRVGRRVFLTVPNRWFPVEHHTGLPLIHYVPAMFRALVRSSSMHYWSDPRNLEFLSKQELHRMWPDNAARVEPTGIPLGPFSSNLALIWPAQGRN